MEIRTVTREEVDPLLPLMKADDLDVLADEGEWIGALANERVVGAARVFECGGYVVVDDVWVEPPARRSGIASSLLHEVVLRWRPLWLICDVPDVAFYEKRGFVRVEPVAFPSALADHYAVKGEWPDDHEHVAMRCDPHAIGP